MGIQAGGPSPLSQILGLEFSLPQAGIPKDLPQIPELLGFFPVFPWFDEVIVKFRDSGNCRGRNGSGGKIPAPTFPNFQTFHWRGFFGESLFQSHFTISSTFGKNPGKYDSTEISGTKGKI